VGEKTVTLTAERYGHLKALIDEQAEEIERLRGILSHVRLTDQLQAEDAWRAEQPAGDPSP